MRLSVSKKILGFGSSKQSKNIKPNKSNEEYETMEKEAYRFLQRGRLDKAEEIFTDSEEKILQDIPYSTIAILYLLNQERLP